MLSRYKVMCGCECFIYSKIIHHHYYHGVIIILKNLRISAKIPKTEGLGRNQIYIYETYKNIVMPHGCCIYDNAYDMAEETMCAYSQSDCALPHWKCVL